MPYNIQRCIRCNAHQVKYLADIDVLYANTHIFPIGNIRSEMDTIFGDMIKEKSDRITGVIEVGGGSGSLCQYVRNHVPSYHIVDPSYTGCTDGIVLIPDIVERCKDKLPKHANTVVMSHVFEHLYEPCKVLDDLLTHNIMHVFICHPDFDSYITKSPHTLNVLHMEHTFLIDNAVVIALMAQRYGFKMTREYSHKNYCVMWEFERTHDVQSMSIRNILGIDDYTRHIRDTVSRINEILHDASLESYDKYMWPCSIHTMTLIHWGVDHTMLKGLLDNSTHKIGKYVYGYNIPCERFSTVINNPHAIVFLAGGCFNREVVGGATRARIVEL